MEAMKLAKQQFDVGLATNDLAPMLDFWQNKAHVPFDHVLKVRRGQNQHRHVWGGSVIKVNHHEKPLGDHLPGGYHRLVLAQPGADAALVDPDGSLVDLVSPGTHGVDQLGLVMKVRSVQAHSDFYKRAFGFVEADYKGGIGFAVGDSRLLLEQSDDAPSDAGMSGTGFRYITFQVFNCDQAHARVLGEGGVEAMAPTSFGETARISMVRDPDGNWIELSQRANLVGTLD